jgi:hypothetical protein
LLPILKEVFAKGQPLAICLIAGGLIKEGGTDSGLSGQSGSVNATSLLGLQLGDGNHEAGCNRLAREPGE